MSVTLYWWFQLFCLALIHLQYALLQQYHSALYRPILADEKEGGGDDVEEEKKREIRLL